ncbi:UNVERIFIED_CONTAM: hypothetical protein GTU68_027085 [Idotea baltica]|nr:hypothetical protein [Idotea baltica]
MQAGNQAMDGWSKSSTILASKPSMRITRAFGSRRVKGSRAAITLLIWVAPDG